MTFFRHRMSGIGASGELWVTTLHSESASSITEMHSAFFGGAYALWTGACAALWSTLQSLTDVVTDQLDPVTGKNVAQVTTSNTHAGTATDSPVSPRDCVVVSLRTALPTRSGRGRMFWPAPTAASLDTHGLLSTTARGLFAAGAADLMASVNGSGTPIVHHKPHLLPFPEGVTGTPITSIRVGNILGSQRRRTNKTVNSYLSSTF